MINIRTNIIVNIIALVIAFFIAFIIFPFDYPDKNHEIKIERTNETECQIENDNRIYGTFYIDTNNLVLPDTFEGVLGRYNKPDDVVGAYVFHINTEMEIISRFIKKTNNRVPRVLADIIAHTTINRCEEHNIPSELVVGIIKVESFYDPYAVSPKGARGLMQVLDKSVDGEPIDHSKLHDIDYNINTGIKILKSKLRATQKNGIGDLDKSLFFYVGKDAEYASMVFKVMGEFRYFRQIVINKIT